MLRMAVLLLSSADGSGWQHDENIVNGIVGARHEPDRRLRRHRIHVTIKVLGTSGRPRVDVDGFIVGS